ncbi:MAG: hypothetical protein WC389_22580 [Lutibacter sp.]|jgi:phosphatidylglycerophosphatase A
MKKVSNLWKAFLALLAVVLPTKALAIDIPGSITGLPQGFNSVSNIVGTIFTIVIAASGIIFIILFLVGGIQYLSSAGNEEATGKAKKLLIDAIIGLVIVLAIWALGRWILVQVGLV